MEFGIEKCAPAMKSGKRHLTDGIELPNEDKIRTLAEDETNKYLGILEADTNKKEEMKNKIQKEYLRRTRKLLETKLSCRNLIKRINTWAVPVVRYLVPRKLLETKLSCRNLIKRINTWAVSVVRYSVPRKLLETKLSCRNLIKRINTWAVSVVRYSGPFLKLTRNELRQIDQKTRKLMTMHKALHPRNDVDRLHVPRKKGGRGLASIEDSVDTSYNDSKTT